MHNYKVRVYYEDTDAAGIVYHANYLGFAERARTEMMRDYGFEHVKTLKNEGIAFAVRHLDISYERPAKLDEELIITSRVLRLGGASMGLEQIFTRAETSEILTKITLTLVCMDIQTEKAVRIPKECRDIFSKMV